MLKVDRVIVVEGKYDKIKLSNFVDAHIITTNGFSVFNNKELQQLLRNLAEKNGLIVLTDSDSAGFMIRRFIGNIANNERIINVYIPEIKGKEKRKESASKEGLLGVEGISEEIISDAFKRAGITSTNVSEKTNSITKTDFYNLGLSGAANSSEFRQEVKSYFSLPSHLTANALIDVLNCITDIEELSVICNKIKSGEIE